MNSYVKSQVEMEREASRRILKGQIRRQVSPVTHFSSFWGDRGEDSGITLPIGGSRGSCWNHTAGFLDPGQGCQADTSRSATPGDWDEGIYATGSGDRAHHYGTHGRDSVFIVSTCNE